MTRRGFVKNLLLAVAIAASGSILRDEYLEMYSGETKLKLSTFAEILNEFMPVELLRAEIAKRDYFLASIPP